MIRKWKAIAPLLLAATALTLVSPAMAQTPPNILVVGQIAEPASLDPHVSTAANDFRIAVNIYDGLVRNRPGTLELAPGGMAAEARQTMENIGAVLKENGLSFAHIFKVTVMMADMAKWADFNKVYVTYFDAARLPARSAFGCNGLALGAQLELECMAYVGKQR